MSYTHNFEEVLDKDEKKQKYLKNLGLPVMRFDDEEILKDMHNVLREIIGFILELEDKN